MNCTRHKTPIRHCFCSVIPEHMMKQIVKNGDDTQKAWANKTLATSARLMMRRDVVAEIPVDAPSITGILQRTIFDAQGVENLPGKLVRSEGNPEVKDIVANEAYDGAGATYELYNSVFKRNSVDDKGLRLDSTIHYGKGYDNAFWDGRQMVYGDGDGRLFNRFTAAIDVIGHELTHGVTQYEAGLVYWDQPGALNEHMSDVFGTLVKQRLLKSTVKNADWLIGAGLLTKSVTGVALRSMKDPGSAYNDRVLGTDPQPGHMKDFVQTAEDNGGVHINSGIPNKVFYLACSNLDDQWKPGMVWYTTLRDRLRSRSTFRDCANFTSAVAAELYGTNGKEQNAVKLAWEAVGIKVVGSTAKGSLVAVTPPKKKPVEKVKKPRKPRKPVKKPKK